MKKKAYFERGEIADAGEGEVAIEEATLIPPAKPTTTTTTRTTIVQPKDYLADLNDIPGTSEAELG